MRRYHHLGIPTLVRREGETYLEQFRVHVSGYESSPYGVEWMRFEPDSLVPELVRSVPHVAFEVDDLEAELAGKQILIPPNSPSPGLTVAFIVDDGAPVEFLYFEPSGQPLCFRPTAR
jgi:hypothetical protein